ncbi:MAG: diaminopropionate ammonia-lyase [Sciscionella sp.]
MDTRMAWLPNRHRRTRAISQPLSGTGPVVFHRSLPGYTRTPLVELPNVAEALNLGTVLVKDESSRLGLPAFKMLGASWATARALAAHYGARRPADLTALQELVRAHPAVRLVTATDGNHGRALARMAALLGLPATVVVPRNVSAAAIRLIRDEGCQVDVLDASYDDAVQHAAQMTQADDTALLVQDTSWPGYETVPEWIVDGYATLFDEAARQAGELRVTVQTVLVPVGVGSLAHAAVKSAAMVPGGLVPEVVAVEPDVADCVRQSLAQGRLRTITTGETRMAGLNCGTPSYLAWPELRDGLAGAVAVDDAAAALAAKELAVHGVDSGPCGAASLAALRLLATNPSARLDLGLDESSVIMLINTEGARAEILWTDEGDG